jgi:hypothetical protein
VFSVFKKRAAQEGKGARPAVDIGCDVRDFFIFRDVLFVRGSIQRAGGADPSISVRLPDGSDQSVRYVGDDFNPSSQEDCKFCFSLPLPVRLSDEEIMRISIVFDFPSGRLVKGDFSKEAVAKDPFLNSEAGYWDYVRSLPDANVLEIGSRARSGISRRNLFPATCSYTGFDIVAGENVDCVGDAHALSRILPAKHFDVVFSVSVWEHLCMPWLVSLELNKVMKVGALAMINTHQSWPSHEEPWDYFRFSNYSWDALFNADTGFEIVARGTGIPCVMAASQFHPSIHANRVDWHYGYFATRCVAKKIGETSLSWPVDPAIIRKGNYPH